MSPDLHSAVWSLPGARQFVGQAAKDLHNGVSLYVLFPPTVDLSGFQQQLSYCLEKEHSLNVRMLDLAGSNGQTPFEFLQEVLNLDGEYSYLEQMVDDYLLPDVILLSLPEAYPSSSVWIDAVARWAEGCRSTGANHSICLFTSVEQVRDVIFPRRDVRLNFKIWAGIPSVLETRLLCRICDDTINAETQWREYLLSSLAGNDLSLGEELWNIVYKQPVEIIASLKEYASKRNWYLEDLSERFQDWRPKPPGLELRLNPNENGFDLLAEGITVYTPEFGEEINSALLALLGRNEEIMHRLWRAQASLILPLIDDVRHRICEYITAIKGDGWAVVDDIQFAPPLELGKLKTYLESLDGNDNLKNQWRGGVFQAWRMRNGLAHYKPVPYLLFTEFWRVSTSTRSLRYQ